MQGETESSIPDAQIIERIRAGDAGAGQFLVRKYWKVLVVVGLRSGLSEADTEEVVNDVFLAALTLACDGRLGPNVGPWLQKVMRNRAIDRYRRDRTTRENETEPLDDFGKAASEQDSEPSKSPEILLLKQVMRGLAQNEGERTGPSARGSDLDILHWIGHDTTNQELAEYLNMNVNAARQRRLRVLRRLKQEMERLRASSHNAAVAQRVTDSLV